MQSLQERFDRLAEDPRDAIYDPPIPLEPLERSRQEILSDTRVIFNPGRVLDVRDRNVGFKQVQRAILQPIKNFPRVQESSIRWREDIDQRVEVAPIYAQHITEEICSVYEKYGLVECPELIGIDIQLVLNMDKALMPVFPKTTLELLDQLDQLVRTLTPDTEDCDYRIIDNLNHNGESAGIENLADIALAVYSRNLQATRIAYEFQMAEVDQAIVDRKNYLQTQKTSFDISDREYARLVGRSAELESFDKQIVVNPEKNFAASNDQMAQGFSMLANIMTQLMTNQQNQAVPQAPIPQAVPEPVVKVATKDCPLCDEPIRVKAIFCKHCGNFINEPEQAAKSKPSSRPKQQPLSEKEE